MILSTEAFRQEGCREASRDLYGGSPSDKLVDGPCTERRAIAGAFQSAASFECALRAGFRAAFGPLVVCSDRFLFSSCRIGGRGLSERRFGDRGRAVLLPGKDSGKIPLDPVRELFPDDPGSISRNMPIKREGTCHSIPPPPSRRSPSECPVRFPALEAAREAIPASSRT